MSLFQITAVPLFVLSRCPENYRDGMLATIGFINQHTSPFGLGLLQNGKKSVTRARLNFIVAITLLFEKKSTQKL